MSFWLACPFPSGGVMTGFLMQILGGGLYLLNKIFMSISERKKLREDKEGYRRWRMAAWISYLCGLPPWLMIFYWERDWIAASVEFAGAPSMLLGLVTASMGRVDGAPKWLDRTALMVLVPAGFIFSIHDFGGITAFQQWLEIGLVTGFLVGTYLLAKERPSGYLWYIIMHLACGYLMWHQGYPWLTAQQAVSLLFVADALTTAWYRRATA